MRLIVKVCLCLVLVLPVDNAFGWFSKSAKKTYDRGIQLVAKGKYTQALSSYKQALKTLQSEKKKTIHPSEIYLARALASLYQMGYRHPLYTKYDYIPQNYFPYDLNAVNHAACRCLYYDPHNLECNVIYAHCLARRNILEYSRKALHILNSIMDAEPENSNLQALFKRIQIQVDFLVMKEYKRIAKEKKDRQPRRALEYLTRAIELADGRWKEGLLYSRANVYFLLRQYEDAVVDVNKVLQDPATDREWAEAKILLGQCYYRTGKFAEAVNVLVLVENYLLSGIYFTFGKFLLPSVRRLLNDIKSEEQRKMAALFQSKRDSFFELQRLRNAEHLPMTKESKDQLDESIITLIKIRSSSGNTVEKARKAIEHLDGAIDGLKRRQSIRTSATLDNLIRRPSIHPKISTENTALAQREMHDVRGSKSLDAGLTTFDAAIDELSRIRRSSIRNFDEINSRKLDPVERDEELDDTTFEVLRQRFRNAFDASRLSESSESDPFQDTTSKASGKVQHRTSYQPSHRKSSLAQKVKID